MHNPSAADTANSFFQVVTIAMVGIFTLATIAQFLAGNIA